MVNMTTYTFFVRQPFLGDDEQCLNTQKKFNYMHLLRETANHGNDEHDYMHLLRETAIPSDDEHS